MALSFHANFSNSLKRNNDIFPLVHIGGSSTIYLSTRNITVDSQAYDGRLLNSPAITSSIDLRNRTSRTSTISLRIANAGYDATFSERTNKGVTIYYATDGTLDDLNNCLKVFVGRVIGITSMTAKEITVSCEDDAAWRTQAILQELVTAEAGYNMSGENILKTLSYGAYEANASDETTSGPCLEKKLRPIKFISHDRDNLYYSEGLVDKGGRPHIYIDGIDRFVPIEQASAGSGSKFNTNTINVNNDDNPATNKSYFRTTVRLAPITDASASDIPGVIDDTGSIANAIKNDDETSIVSVTAVQGGDDPVGVFGEMSGTLNGTIKSVRAVIRARSELAAGVEIWLKAGDGTTILNQAITGANGWSPVIGNTSAAYVNSKKDITSVWNNNAAGTNLNGIIYGYYQTVGTGSATLQLAEMYLEFTTYIPIDTENAKAREQELPPVLYVGTDADTLESGYDSVGTDDFTPTEVHYNILRNFGPGASAISSASEINIRSNYTDSVRCTIDSDSMTVQDALIKLQKEAGFISFYKPIDGKIHYLIEDATSKSIDQDLTQNTYRNISFSTIPLSQVLWKVNYKYDKHPAKGTYLTSASVSDPSTKSQYSFGDNDGVVTLNQDWVNENEAAVNLLALFKYQRVTAQCEILDPTKWTLEIGDIITFSDPPADFSFRGGAYTDYQFRITETTRTVNSLKIKAMEVYKA
tara:strand:- start:1426 stop:3522 length:2097 start_codon:yes stop_codon:yes gene_type:complete